MRSALGHAIRSSTAAPWLRWNNYPTELPTLYLREPRMLGRWAPKQQASPSLQVSPEASAEARVRRAPAAARVWAAARSAEAPRRALAARRSGAAASRRVTLPAAALVQRRLPEHRR